MAKTSSDKSSAASGQSAVQKKKNRDSSHNKPSRHIFPSMAWCKALAAAIHSDSRSSEAGRGWHGTVCVAVREDDLFHRPFNVFARIADGKILEIRQLEDEDEIDETDPDYVAKADYLTWKRFIRGEYDPIEALLQRKISFRGNLKPIAERAQYKELFWEALASVPTIFHDGES